MESTSINEWDAFFKFVLENELPKGAVYDCILKNYAIYLFQKGITEERLISNIKPLYDKNQWCFTDLFNWYKAAAQGKYQSICKGELVNWCNKFHPELLRYVPYESMFLSMKDLCYSGQHLPNYSLIKEIVQLKGKEYDFIKKSVYYFLISLSAPEKLKVISVNSGFETDTRLHLNFVLPSGKGKLAIKQGIKDVYLLSRPNAIIKEPSTIHMQHLLGKVLNRGTSKEPFFIIKLGFLFAELFIVEESHEFLTSKDRNYTECRDKLLQGLDIYKKNFVYKESMDNLDTPEETIAGYPAGLCLMFGQPYTFPDIFFTKGNGRRSRIIYQIFSERTDPKLFQERLHQKNSNESELKEFSEFMKKINSIKGEWSFDDEFLESFSILHLALLEQGYLLGKKSQRFISIMEWHLQNELLKYSALNALANSRTNLTRADAINAFVDLMEVLVHQLEFVNTKVSGQLSYNLKWGADVSLNKQDLLEWLHHKKAIDNKSNVRIYDFQKQIREVFNCGDRQARTIYQELKSEGLIADKYGNQNTPTAVWLLKRPEDDEDGSGSSSSGNINNFYHINPKQIYKECCNSAMAASCAMANQKIKEDTSNCQSATAAIAENDIENEKKVQEGKNHE